MWNVKRTSFLLRVGAFRPKYYGNGVFLCRNVDTERYQQVYALQLCRWKFLDNESLIAEFYCFFVEIYAKKRQIWVSEPHFAEVRGDPRPCLIAEYGSLQTGKPPENDEFLFALIVFSLSISELWGEMCTARLFSQEVDALHSNFTWTGSSPINHSWHQKIRVEIKGVRKETKDDEKRQEGRKQRKGWEKGPSLDFTESTPWSEIAGDEQPIAAETRATKAQVHYVITTNTIPV